MKALKQRKVGFSEAKENLELEMGELRTSHENLLVENSLLQARLEKFHELEGIVYSLEN